MLAYEPQAFCGYLSYVQVPRKDQTAGDEAYEYLKKQGLNTTHDAIVTEQESTAQGYYLGVVLVEPKEEDLANSLNAYMCAEGLAKLRSDDDLPEDIQEWQTFEDEAKENSLGIWEYGNAANLNDDY